MSQPVRFDAHCHIFTIRYVLKEAKSFVYDVYHRNYPWGRRDTPQISQTKEAVIADIKQKFRWILELAAAALSSERRNLNFLQRQGKKAFPDASHSIIPLMMDVYYIFSYSLDKDEDYPHSFVTEVELEQEVELQSIWDEILDDLKVYVKDKLQANSAIAQSLRDYLVQQALEIIQAERDAKQLDISPSKPKALGEAIDYYHTDGFDYHMGNLQDLVRSRRGEIYPFVAVDPRREGMIETVMTGRFFTGNRRFYGVKLYPRLGYHPQCKPLMPLYAYCQENGIPITFHCGMDGFPPGTSWKWTEYGNPANFEPIVKQFPNLRINFAHMGSRDPDRKWEKTVFRLINENENVYTDLSCYTDFDILKSMRKYWVDSEQVQRRLMYGSDFDVMYFVEHKLTMEEYIENFKKIFPDEMGRMMIDNPKSFLGVQEQPLCWLQKILYRWF